MRGIYKFMVHYWRDRQSREGLLALAVSLAFMGGWLRSEMISNEFDIEGHSGDEIYLIRSHHGAIRWIYREWSQHRRAIREEEIFSIPYWCIVTPLIFYVGFTLLRRLREQNEESNAESPGRGAAKER